MTYQEQINLLEALKLHYELFNLEYAESEEDKEMEIDFRKKCLKKLLKELDKWQIMWYNKYVIKKKRGNEKW